MDTKGYEAIASEYYKLLGQWQQAEDEAEKARLHTLVEAKLNELYAATGERRDPATVKANISGFDA